MSDKKSTVDEILEKCPNLKLNVDAMKEIRSQEEEGRKLGEERLKRLELLMGKEMPANYREGFIQGYYEGMFQIK